MSVFQDTDTVAYLFLHQIPHTLSKRTGIADGGSLTDTGGKGDGVRSLTHQGASPQHRLFPRAAATVDKAYQLDVVLAFKSALSFPDGTKIPASWALILCLHTTDNTKFNIVFLLK